MLGKSQLPQHIPYWKHTEGGWRYHVLGIQPFYRTHKHNQ
jgi:hypothetical protein